RWRISGKESKCAAGRRAVGRVHGPFGPRSSGTNALHSCLHGTARGSGKGQTGRGEQRILQRNLRGRRSHADAYGRALAVLTRTARNQGGFGSGRRVTAIGIQDRQRESR